MNAFVSHLMACEKSPLFIGLLSYLDYVAWGSLRISSNQIRRLLKKVESNSRLNRLDVWVPGSQWHTFTAVRHFYRNVTPRLSEIQATTRLGSLTLKLQLPRPCSRHATRCTMIVRDELPFANPKCLAPVSAFRSVLSGLDPTDQKALEVALSRIPQANLDYRTPSARIEIAGQVELVPMIGEITNFVLDFSLPEAAAITALYHWLVRLSRSTEITIDKKVVYGLDYLNNMMRP